MLLQLLRRTGEHLLRLGELAARDQRAREAGERLGVLLVLLQDLRIERRGAGMVAGLRGLLGHGHRLFDRRRPAGPAAETLDELLDLAFRLGADKAVDRPAVLEGIDRR